MELLTLPGMRAATVSRPLSTISHRSFIFIIGVSYFQQFLSGCSRKITLHVPADKAGLVPTIKNIFFSGEASKLSTQGAELLLPGTWHFFTGFVEC
ncbi:MAG: hypothetical protein K8I60_13930 [Anaerolineae bacterium]|nr:hypothetical protein [Anaerolineae bacterium]